MFSPTFSRIQTELNRIIDSILNAVQMFPRIEFQFPNVINGPTPLFAQPTQTNPTAAAIVYLKPIIPPHFVTDCRQKIEELLEEERIGPELRLQDFDEYLSLMNGIDASKVYQFMADDQDFREYCHLIKHYNNIEKEICLNIWGVIAMGLYEFHRDGLIDTLVSLAKFMQRELLQRMVSDQQAGVAQLQAEYEAISNRSLTVPGNTAQLMESKAYVNRMEEEVIPEMEDRLRVVS